MADLALDTLTHDMLVQNDALSIVTGEDALVQHLKIRLQFVLGEWFLDTRVGIPYFQDILIKNPDLVLVRGLLRQSILTTPGVASMEEFNLDFDNAIRKLTVSFSVRKTDGEVLTFNEEFIVG